MAITNYSRALSCHTLKNYDFGSDVSFQKKQQSSRQIFKRHGTILGLEKPVIPPFSYDEQSGQWYYTGDKQTSTDVMWSRLKNSFKKTEPVIKKVNFSYCFFHFRHDQQFFPFLFSFTDQI